MGKYAANFRKRNSLAGNQIMDDADAGFRHYGQFKILQVIVILVDRARQCVFDGHHRAGGAPLLDAAKDIFEPFAGNHGDIRPGEFAAGLFAEGAARSLKRDGFAARLHRGPSQRRTAVSGAPIRSRTRSTL